MTFNERMTDLLQMPLSPLTWDSILRECDRIQHDFVHIMSTYKWTLDYKRFQVEQARRNTSAALWHLKSAIATVPYNTELQEDYKNLVGQQAGIHSLVLIITSKIDEARALRLAAQFDQADIDYMLVSGGDTPSIAHARALQVDVPDRHEALPQKVAAAFSWVYENIGNNVGILKVADDMVLQDGARLHSGLEQLAAQGGYAGVPTGGVEHDRCGHWGLCLAQDLNHRVYGRPVLRSWAAGGAYYVGARALEKLVLSLTRFPGLFEGEYYEDKLMGDVLALEGESLGELDGYADLGFAQGNAAAVAKNVPLEPANAAAAPAPAPVSAPASVPAPASAAAPAPAPASAQAAPPPGVAQRAQGPALKLSEWDSR